MKIDEKIENYYYWLAEQFLIEKYSLRSLDERFQKSTIPFISVRKQEAPFLTYISLWNRPKLERLSEKELTVIKELTETGESKIVEDILGINLAEFLQNTYQKVLAEDMREGMVHEFYPSIYGDGILPAKAIVFRFEDKIAYDENGSILWEIEQKKNNIFNSVKRQLETLIRSKNKEDLVYLVRM